MTIARVQISVSLLEKLAGIRKDPNPRSHKQQHSPGLAIGQLGLPGLPRDLAAAAAAAAGGSASHGQLDSSLQQAIQSSRRVGELLLKSEEQEVAAVQQRAQELVQQYSTAKRPEPCTSEKLSALECYQQHPQDALKCASLVDAYAACAAHAAGQLMT